MTSTGAVFLLNERTQLVVARDDRTATPLGASLQPAAAGLIVHAQDEAALLARLPLALLTLSEPARELCVLLGLRSAGALRDLPPGTLALRLGAEGARLEKLCRGDAFALWPTSQKVPREPERVELDLDFALEGLEPLLLAFRSLLDRLLAALAAERRALSELGVVVRLDDRSEVVERFIPESPALLALPLLELLTLWLERRPFRERVVGLRLTATRVAPASASQLSLLRQREELAEAALGRAVARLSAAFGHDAVLTATLCDTFRPERRLAWVSAVDHPPVSAVAHPPQREIAFPSCFTGTPLTLALRQVSPPERASIRDATYLVLSGRKATRILRSDGPQCLTGEWWHDGFRRSYYWLLLDTGELAWIYRDEQLGQLFLQAWVD